MNRASRSLCFTAVKASKHKYTVYAPAIVNQAWSSLPCVQHAIVKSTNELLFSKYKLNESLVVAGFVWKPIINLFQNPEIEKTMLNKIKAATTQTH